MAVYPPLEVSLVLHPTPTPREGNLLPAAFRDYCCQAAHLKEILPRLAASGPMAAEFMLMVHVLGRRSAGNFADIVDLKTQAGGRGRAEPTASTIWAMRDIFIAIVNRRLQRLYRGYFTDSPALLGMRQEEKIALLGNVRERVQSIVASFDWRWLADWLRLDLVGESAESCLDRLSNFAFPVKRVTFRFTYHCNISCRHCYNSSGPHEKAQRIERDAMRAIIAQMPGAGIPALNLTDGEPFLYPDDLMELIAAGMMQPAG